MFASPSPSAPPEPGTRSQRVYAVGDIHGRIDALCELLEIIFRDARLPRAASRPLLVFLGDYVDRGPNVREVIDTLVTLKASPVLEVVALRGNHEDALLRFLDDPATGPEWARWGGLSTLASYGVAPPRLRTRVKSWTETRDAFAGRLPADHRTFFETLPLQHVVGDYIFVHAGVRPGVDLSDQSETDLLTIRDPFLTSDEWHGKVVVHGHTISETPVDRSCRIGVDTGAYVTGILTAVRLYGSERRFLQSSSRSRRPASMAEIAMKGDHLG